jgi:hypothetical protein
MLYSRYRPAFQHLHSAMLPYICMFSFRFSRCLTLSFLKAFVSILSFLILLRSLLYNEAGKGSGKQRGIRGGSPSGLKRKEEAMTRVADSMTEKSVASKERQDKRTEKGQLERDTSTYYVSVCTLPESADGNSTRAFLNSKIHSHKARIEQTTNWFDDNPSPSNSLLFKKWLFII